MAGGYGAPGAEQLGQGDAGRRGVTEDGPYAAQHLGERAARPDLAELGRGHQIGVRVEGGQPQPLALRGGGNIGLVVG